MNISEFLKSLSLELGGMSKSEFRALVDATPDTGFTGVVAELSEFGEHVASHMLKESSLGLHNFILDNFSREEIKHSSWHHAPKRSVLENSDWEILDIADLNKSVFVLSGLHHHRSMLQENIQNHLDKLRVFEETMNASLQFNVDANYVLNLQIPAKLKNFPTLDNKPWKIGDFAEPHFSNASDDTQNTLAA